MTDIVLSTYNGEEFLAEQLDSLLNQTDDDWRLLVRDDGSEDRTVEILHEYAGRFSEKMKIIDGGRSERLGPCGSFGRLLDESQAEYIAFCDQDDVWMSDKLKKLLEVVRREEKHAGAGEKMPIAVYSDMEVVDRNMYPIAESFMLRNALRHDADCHLPRLLLRNCVTGCAMIFSRKLLERALPLPETAVMHDWWLALCAAACGKIVYMPEKLVKYRQHGGNVYGSGGGWNNAAKFADMPGYSANLAAFSRQAEVFLERFKKNLDMETAEFAEAFGKLHGSSFFGKRMIILKHCFPYQSIKKSIYMLLGA